MPKAGTWASAPVAGVTERTDTRNTSIDIVVAGPAGRHRNSEIRRSATQPRPPIHPIPIPEVGARDKFTMAFSLGTREEAKQFRAALLEKGQKDWSDSAFEMPGRYPRYAREKYTFLVTRLKDGGL